VSLPKSVLLTLALAGAVAAAGAAVPDAVEATRIPGYHRIDPSLATAGQPSAEALASLKSLGFATVVNLRPPAEELPAEEKIVEGQGLRYVDVPVTAETFSAADVDAVAKVLEDPSSGPVLLHCASANRAGAVVAVLEARRGKALDEAIAAGRAAGMHGSTMEDAVRRVLGAPPPPAVAPPAPAPAPHS
jgi:uncharacterized protein (TIGR01244 family)